MQTDIANTMRAYALDKKLTQKSQDSSSARALIRRREASKMAAKQKRMKSFILVAFYGTLLFLSFAFLIIVILNFL